MTVGRIGGPVLRIDREALVSNYHIIRTQAAGAEVAGVVKADAYGVGADIVVPALISAGCQQFFVAQYCEAVAVKPLLQPDCDIFVLNGLLPGEEDDCAALGVIPVLNALHQLDRWAALAQRLGRELPAALQIDSGMSRLGLPDDEFATLIANPVRMKGISIRLVMSHLACADDPGDPANADQRWLFLERAAHFPDAPRSLDNSGGSFLPRDHLELVRAGVALYGGRPSDAGNPMRPVLSLHAPITQLRTVPAGSGVGYGLSHRCIRTTMIATIPMGYADGWPRTLGNRGSAFIGGIRVPIAGRVSMDSITLDVTEVPAHLLHPGAPVELIGPHQSVDDVATDAGTISYEILTSLGRRYVREIQPLAASPLNRSNML